jgi:hypothetical protein
MKIIQEQLCGRTVVGYDLRRPESLPGVHMTSYDERARYETIYDLYESQLSGLNLFTGDPSEIPSFLLPERARVIAFDLPTLYVEAMAKGNVSVPPMLPWFAELDIWKFLGFDIVDTQTQSSALYLYLSKNAYAGAGDIISTNEHNLAGNIELAEKCSKKFDTKYPEHAPWVPCGVWLKEQPAGTGSG